MAKQADAAKQSNINMHVGFNKDDETENLKLCFVGQVLLTTTDGSMMKRGSARRREGQYQRSHVLPLDRPGPEPWRLQQRVVRASVGGEASPCREEEG